MASLALLALIAALTPDDPACRETTDSLIAKVERNYPGVSRELFSDAQRVAWRARQDAARRLADRATGADCLQALRHVTDGWRDEHLFVFQSPALDSAETVRRVAEAPRRALRRADWQSRWARATGLDPVEGHWFGDGLEVAIVPTPRAGHFEAIVLVPDTSTWEPGMVRATLVRRTDDTLAYDVSLASRAHQHLRYTAHVVRGTLLRMPPLMWGRRAPASAAAGAPAYPDPRRPTLDWLDDSVALLSLPSLDGRYRAPLDSLLRAHGPKLAEVERLVVDLRGNEGGGTGTVAPLAPYVVAPRAADERPARIADWRPLMLATPENERAVARMVPAGRDTSPWLRGLLDRLRSAPAGTAVRYLQDDELSPRWRPAVVHDRPARIAILVDRHVVSAAEAFLLEALRSPRVTLFGEPTGGVLDYGSTSLIAIRPGERRWYLGYPTIIANDSVPARGIRGRGVQPDVPIDPAAPDAIAPVRRRMR